MQRPTHRFPLLAGFVVLVFFAVPLAPASGGIDRKAPSMPANVRVTGTTTGSVSVGWDASRDNKGSTQLVGYGLYRSRVLVATTTATASTFTGLSCGTTYTFGIDAVDASANRSQLAEVTATTSACATASSPPASTLLPDLSPPSTPTALTPTSSSATTVSLSWNRSTDDVAVAGYGVYRNGSPVATTTLTSYTFVGLSCGTSYALGVDAYDAAGHHSATATVTVSTAACADDVPPTAPTNLMPTAVTASTISLSWAPSFDNVGVAGYEVQRDGVRVTTTALTNATVAGLTCGTSYTLAVAAVDAAGNRSTAASVVVSTAPCQDQTPPTAPANLTAAGATQTSISVSWTASTDNVAVVGYSAFVAGSLTGRTSSTTYSLTGLTCGTTYTIGVEAYDAAGNVSPRTAISAGTSACTTTASRPGGPLVPATGALFGAYVSASTTGQTVTDFESMIGRKLAVDHHYYAWGDLPGAVPQSDFDNGRTPLISLGGDTTFPGFDAVNNGSQDAYIHSFAQRLKSYAKPLFFRPWYEMNGNWFPWDGTHNNTAGTYDGPAKLVQAWKRVHDIFVQEGATNVVWVWCPNFDSVPNQTWNDFRNYYPGDAFVDWVGIDGYNWGTNRTWSSWTSFASVIDPVYSAYARSKPIMIAETGSVEQGGDKAQWIADAAASMKLQFPSIAAFVWFHSNHSPDDYRVNSSPAALSAYKVVAADPYFGR